MDNFTTRTTEKQKAKLTNFAPKRKRKEKRIRKQNQATNNMQSVDNERLCTLKAHFKVNQKIQTTERGEKTIMTTKEWW